MTLLKSLRKIARHRRGVGNASKVLLVHEYHSGKREIREIERTIFEALSRGHSVQDVVKMLNLALVMFYEEEGSELMKRIVRREVFEIASDTICRFYKAYLSASLVSD